MTSDRTLYCSFCAKSQHEVRILIAAPVTAFICDECIERCNEIISDRTDMRRDMVAGDIGLILSTARWEMKP